jgi:pimeloyl-ACP methyl ester carboxylesterase
VRSPLDVEILGRGPALLVLHGAGGSPRDNYPFLDELARTFTVIAPSLPGVGASPLETPLDVVDVADQVAAVLDDLAIASAAVCGYSMGTTIAAQLAAAHPDRISAMALCAGFVTPRPAMRSLVEVWDALLQGPADILGRFVVGAVYRPETLDERGSDWIELAAKEIGGSFPSGTRAHLDLIRRVDTSAALASTTQPLLVVVPELDGMVHPAHSADLLAARPDGKRVGLNASHALGDEVPAEWLAELVDFFTTNC